MAFNTGNNNTVADNSQIVNVRASDKLALRFFNKNKLDPDIVERWAPIIWADINQGEGRCDHLAAVGL